MREDSAAPGKGYSCLGQEKARSAPGQPISGSRGSRKYAGWCWESENRDRKERYGKSGDGSAQKDHGNAGAGAHRSLRRGSESGAHPKRLCEDTGTDARGEGRNLSVGYLRRRGDRVRRSGGGERRCGCPLQPRRRPDLRRRKDLPGLCLSPCRRDRLSRLLLQLPAGTGKSLSCRAGRRDGGLPGGCCAPSRKVSLPPGGEQRGIPFSGDGTEGKRSGTCHAEGDHRLFPHPGSYRRPRPEISRQL